ncbi:MAG: flagellar protein FlgN [Gammaproteobacteria bacterium]|nr:flagellar protein FlgN [Gammaproteobacteria bacterium]MDH5776578.1 flagellar protein FlgN [Gammaproteobacteria bacterium]
MKASLDKAGIEFLLREMYETLSELAMVLDNEHSALENSDIDKMHQAAVSKEQLSKKLEALETSRSKILKKARFHLDKQSMYNFIDTIAGSTAESLHKIWEMVEELASTCDTQNKINGIVIDNSKRQTQAALSILHGHAQTEGELYDAEGTNVPHSFNSSLARA